MHAHLEESAITRSDCPIQHLSWMGKVPDSLPEEDGWKLNRANYYEEGWLATGNTGGIVGVTFTAAHSKTTTADTPPRTNFNLRGHRSEVVLVKWNEPYQKLATCDVTGVIFVWIKHEGRWSIELINDRSSQVTDFTWSHDGRMALICYRDGFVLVGSVAGQRYWSSMLNLDSCLITCGAWSHDDQKVLFGTTDGQLIIMSASGVMLSQITVQENVEVVSLVWACEKFYLSEQDSNTTSSTPQSDTKLPLLAVSFRTGAIYLVSNYDDLCPKVIHTGLTGLKVEWSNDGEILAVAGFVRLPNLECCNEIRFYNRQGYLRYRLPLPKQGKPVSHLTWGHNDRRLFVALGCHIYTVWVTKKVASLQLLCQHCIQQRVKEEANVQRLPLPAKIQAGIQALFCPTIRGYIPHPLKLREFVCIPPSSGERLYCTMIRHGEECSGGHYTLYLEYLGGLIPLLKGKRASKLRPEFIIFDPKIKSANCKNEDDSVFVSSDSSDSDFESDRDVAVEGCGSPRMQRSRKNRKCKDRYERRDSTMYAATRSIDELMYDDNLPECHRLVEVTSNIWGTKFKLHSLVSFLPEDLGQVLYKTSLLHLQPRQMTVTIVEINPELKPVERDPTYNPNQFSESEDEAASNLPPDGDLAVDGSPRGAHFPENLIAISPEGPTCPYPIPALGSFQHWPEAAGAKNKHSNELFPEAASPRTPTSAKPDQQLAPLEICSLDGSPPQRRIPNSRSRPTTASSHGLCTNDVPDPEGAEAGDCRVAAGRARHQPTLARSLSDKCTPDRDQTSSVDRTSVDAGSPSLASSSSDFGIVEMSASAGESADCDKDVASGSADASCSPNGSRPPTTRQQQQQQLSLWANKACRQLKYIDDDADDDAKEAASNRETVYCNVDELGARQIMCSMQMLHQLEQAQQSCSMMTGCGDLGPLGPTSVLAAHIQTLPAFELQKKRVVLSKAPDGRPRSKLKDLTLSSLRPNARCLEVSRGDRCKPRSSSVESCRSRSASPTPSRCHLPSNAGSQLPLPDGRRGSFDLCRSTVANHVSVPSAQSTSLPNSPVHKILGQNGKRSKTSHRHGLRSPLARRRQKHSRAVDSSDDEVVFSGDDVMTSENYRNLETFQKAQLNRKLRKARSRSEAEATRGSPNTSPHNSPHCSPILARKCHFVMHNKAPMWNENSQVYQLDFGGRVTQESAKNFQIEFRGKQVMQFGRIDSNAYTLDFQHPFSAIQAFAVALANVTQRLK